MVLHYGESYADIIGMIGVVMVLSAYYFLNMNRFNSLDLRYLLMNFFGSWLILFSLLFTWNTASVIIEIAWILISMIGLYRYYKQRGK
jgi:hypothetical protein